MKKNLFIVSIIYFTVIIALSFCWENLSLNNSKKGGDIIFCAGLIALVTLIYSFISKLIVGKAFLIMPMDIMPFISFTASIATLLIANICLGGMSDYLNLQIYFYLNAVAAIAYIYLVTDYSTKHNSS